ncbi:MAG: LysM peptidoglycan-binding domain-containing protein [Tannerella sp.]|jgi:LysM repeat protein|nr:LysM peptidoglycan-binding domain-containing protein [Tannerella sp.]
MKRISLFTLLWALCLIAIKGIAQDNRTAVNGDQNKDVFYHTVERGQTLYSIAKMYDVTLEEIVKLNTGSDEAIRAGEKLKIPQKKSPVKAETATEPVEEYIFHTIQTRETLYGVSKQYGVSGENILEANSGLSLETFSIGRTIRIPTGKKEKQTAEIIETDRGAKEIYYRVPAKETLYNICRTFKTSEKELLKLNPELAGGLHTGMTLRIPMRIDEKDLPKEIEKNENEVNSMLDVKKEIKPVKATKIAILLPYDADSPGTTDLKKRVVEYYEGLLLAVDSMRNMGHTTELFVYDIGEQGTARTAKILQEKRLELSNVNLIIGGVSTEQISMIAEFAKLNKVNYVIPFSSKTDDVLSNQYVFQVNTPPAYLYANAAFAGANLFFKHNIIFLDTRETEENQTEFIKQFKQELTDGNIKYIDAVYHSDKFMSEILASLSTTRPNMIMPVSSSVEALTKIKTILRSIAQTKPEYKITLFGYPLWQTYSKECLDDFHALDTHIYSLFYADNTSTNVKLFYDKFKNWYSKSPQSIFTPKYAMLGFDTGMFFLGAIQTYGVNFENNLSKIKYRSLQTGFNFERVNNWGGFMNTNVYIIHYNKNFTITRSDFK